jgi:hypothetical protein
VFIIISFVALESRDLNTMSSAIATAPAHAAALATSLASPSAPQNTDESNQTRAAPPIQSQSITLPATQPVTQKGTSPSLYELDIICGPLINYKHLSDELSNSPRWHGSVLIVTKPDQAQPELVLRSLGAIGEQGQTQSSSEDRRFPGEKLYHDSHKAFFRFLIDVPVQDFEANWEYSFTQSSNASPNTFTVPSKQQSMRILFHSCNGFSIGTDEDAWSGPALWNDVNRTHKIKPFHVMIGGGDQIYNDNVRVGDGPLKEWTDIGNPRKRREYPFDEKLRLRCDQHYYDNYIRWYGMEPFKSANCVIPQLNIWDDHDIIDGFGSYTDHFMKCHVFRGIGGVANKYVQSSDYHQIRLTLADITCFSSITLLPQKALSLPIASQLIPKVVNQTQSR